MTGDRPRHLIQFTDRYGHHTTVLCWAHRGELLVALRVAGVGITGTTAPLLSRCDDCENLKETP